MPPKIDDGFDPIQAKHRENMQEIFGAISDALPGVGMCLFVFVNILPGLNAGVSSANVR
jgi:hypothetical protein